MSEDSILRKVLPALRRDEAMVVGPGDDCAVLEFGGKWLLAAVDQVASEVHYHGGATPPEAIAAKLLKRNLSDIAAMGGIPRWALLALAATPREDGWFERFFAGLEAAAREFGVTIAGGDLGGLPGAIPAEYGALTILGEVEPEKLCRRDRARVGEVLMVTGELGNTLATGHHLDFTPRLAEGRFLAGAWTHCMMDLSDGLGQDLRRLGLASELGFEVDLDRLPCRAGADAHGALADGEDYELVFTVASEKAAGLAANWPFAAKLSAIGRAVAAPPGKLIWMNAGAVAPEEEIHGYEHFRT